jgi:hypothetical protein
MRAVARVRAVFRESLAAVVVGQEAAAVDQEEEAVDVVAVAVSRAVGQAAAAARLNATAWCFR